MSTRSARGTEHVVSSSWAETMCFRQQICVVLVLVMAALCNRAGHHIFALWFLSFFYLFSLPNLSGRRLDVYHTSTHGVALVRI